MKGSWSEYGNTFKCRCTACCLGLSNFVYLSAGLNVKMFSRVSVGFQKSTSDLALEHPSLVGLTEGIDCTNEKASLTNGNACSGVNAEAAAASAPAPPSGGQVKKTKSNGSNGTSYTSRSKRRNPKYKYLGNQQSLP